MDPNTSPIDQFADDAAETAELTNATAEEAVQSGLDAFSDMQSDPDFGISQESPYSGASPY